MSPRLYYLARAHPELTDGAFARRWAAHGALGMSLPRWRNVALYLQCDRIAGAPWDGVAVVAFRSEEARLAHVADPDGAITRADEALCFDRPVSRTACIADGDPGLRAEEGGLRLFRFLSDPPASWGPEHEHLLRAVDPAATGARLVLRPGSVAGFTMVEEIATSKPAAAAAALALAEPAGRAFPPPVWVAARVRILWPAGQYQA